MASIITCIATGAAWCFCTASASLLSACCGNDKPSTIPPSATSGRRRSVGIVILTLVISFIFQYGVAPRLIGITYTNYVTDAWTDGCEGYDQQILQERCAGNAGVYRATSSAFLFYILAAVAVLCKPTANREAWPAKYVLFCFLAFATCFIPNEPLFSDVFLQIARIGSVFCILFQQIVFIDMAYNWNDSWVCKSNAAEAEEVGSGKKWLLAILVSCAILFIGSIVTIGLLFRYFSGCGTNQAFIAVTLVMGIVVTLAQLRGEEGSLLSSALIVAYSTYLCYTAVSKNPNGECNPLLGDDDVLGIVLGVGLTLISMGWTGWSSTAETTVTGGTDLSENLVDETGQTQPNGEKKVTGIVISRDDETKRDEEAQPASTEQADRPTGGLSGSWKLNIILAKLTCWIAMSLTGWGSISSGGDVANPDVGKVSMWMIIASQWIVLSLYLWSLVAPRLFPDRDFS